MQNDRQKRPCAEQTVLCCRHGQTPAATSSLPWKRLPCSPACLKSTRSCTACGSCTASCQRFVGLRPRRPTACQPVLLHRCSLTSARYATRSCPLQAAMLLFCVMQHAAKAGPSSPTIPSLTAHNMESACSRQSDQHVLLTVQEQACHSCASLSAKMQASQLPQN